MYPLFFRIQLSLVRQCGMQDRRYITWGFCLRKKYARCVRSDSYTTVRLSATALYSSSPRPSLVTLPGADQESVSAGDRFLHICRIACTARHRKCWRVSPRVVPYSGILHSGHEGKGGMHCRAKNSPGYQHRPGMACNIHNPCS